MPPARYITIFRLSNNKCESWKNIIDTMLTIELSITFSWKSIVEFEVMVK